MEEDVARSASVGGLLAVQQSAGNRAAAAMVAQGMMGSPPRHSLVAPTGTPHTLQREKVKHTSGEKVDKYLKSSKMLGKLVEARFKAGVSAKAAVKIHDAAAFKTAWMKYALVRQNPDTGKTFSKAEATSWETTVNAFQDSSDNSIHIHEERGEPGTAIHESIHLFADPGWSSMSGFSFNTNEGATEYFTRVICGEQKIKRGAFYPDQRRAVDRLVGRTSRTRLRYAFFTGQTAEMKKYVDSSTKAGTFDMWLGFMAKGKYTSANALMK